MAAEAEPKDRVGFKRAEMFSEPLYGTVKPYKTHIFVAHGTCASWAGKLETAEGPLKALTDAAEAAAEALKASPAGKCKITAFEAVPEAGDEEGDVILYPQMLRLRPAPPPDALIAALASGGAAALPGATPVAGPAVFVCCHARRDKRCGVCGPALMEAFSSALKSRPHLASAPVRGCSHVGGHAYAGNVLVFTGAAGEPASVRGDWFGYVAPGDVGGIIDGPIAKGEDPPTRLWRGRMGMSVDDHTALCTARLAAEAKECAGAGGGAGGGGAGGSCDGCDAAGKEKGCAAEAAGAPQAGASGGGGLLGWAFGAVKSAVGYGKGGDGGSQGAK